MSSIRDAKLSDENAMQGVRSRRFYSLRQSTPGMLIEGYTNYTEVPTSAEQQVGLNIQEVAFHIMLY